MIPPNKMNLKFTKIKKSKTNINNIKNRFPSFSKNPPTNYITNIPNMRYIQQDNQIIFRTNTGMAPNPNLNNTDIKEFEIKNIPNDILYKKRPNKYQNNNLKNSIYTQRTIETYEIPLGKNYGIHQPFLDKENEKENRSMDITYYKPIIYINKNDNNNSFYKKLDNNEFFTQNNSFYLNGTNIEDNTTNINLNNTINYNREKYYKNKNIITSIKNIPKPKKFRRGIPPIRIKKINESNNNSFYFEDNEINKEEEYLQFELKK